MEDIKYPEIVKKGIYCREDKYRFRCWVNVDGEEHLCYLPSNCKLGKIYSLEGREVLLSRQKDDDSKFDYKVEAIIYRNGQILLNLSFLNRVVEQEIHRRVFNIDMNSEYGKLMNECQEAGVHFIAMNLHSRKGKYRVKEFININYSTKHIRR